MKVTPPYYTTDFTHQLSKYRLEELERALSMNKGSPESPNTPNVNDVTAMLEVHSTTLNSCPTDVSRMSATSSSK